MGRPEARIPEHRPMKALADYLRHLRHQAGSPSYRTLGALVHVEQQSLSQTANGHRVGWGRVLLYAQALRRYDPQAVNPTELATLKQLHQAGERQFQAVTTRNLRRRQSTAFWSEVDAVTTLGAHTAARHRPPGRWELTPGITDMAQFNGVRTVADLYTVLTGVAARYGIDLVDTSRSRPRPADRQFSWFDAAPAQPARHVPQVAHPDQLTSSLLSEIVRLCGGTEGDCTAWLSIWRRVQPTTSGESRLQAPVLRPPDPPDRPPITGAVPRQRADWPGEVLRRPDALGTLTT